MTTFSGSLPTPADGAVILGADIAALANALHALGDPWTDFSGSVGWTSAGTAPSIGNGAIAASYIQIGKFVSYRGRITMGATTSYGSANPWQVNLPVTAVNTVGAGPAFIFDSSTTANKQPGVVGLSTTFLTFFAVGGPVAQTVPIPWAAGDILNWSISYEAA